MTLTNRETEVIELYSEGKTYREISQALYIGEWTVKQHIKSVANKLDMKPRAACVHLALKNLIKPNLS